MSFEKELPEWNAPGIVPSEEAKKSGWGPNQHPPADWFNWQWNLTYQALKELQENAQHIDDSVSIGDASLTQKGVTQLNDKVDSDSTTQAATANAVKKVNDAVVTHSADEVKHITAAERTSWNAKETTEGARKKIEQNDFKIYKSNKDSEGIYTNVEYNRADGTLAIKSVLSGGKSPNYTTRTITYYNAAGTMVEKTITRTLSYDADGDLISEV